MLKKQYRDATESKVEHLVGRKSVVRYCVSSRGSFHMSSRLWLAKGNFFYLLNLLFTSHENSREKTRQVPGIDFDLLKTPVAKCSLHLMVMVSSLILFIIWVEKLLCTAFRK